MTNCNLTAKQLDVLQTIQRLARSRRYSATIAELAEELNNGRSTVFEHVSRLRKMGLVTESRGRARSLKLTAKASRLLKKPVEYCSDPYPQDQQSQNSIPLAGTVAAGNPIEAIEDRQNLNLSSVLSGHSQCYALRVTGQSMIEEGIMDGDYVICRKSCSANNGDLVVAILGPGEATLKRFYKEKNRARLQPANSAFQPIYTNDCRIEAVVVGLVRKY